MQMRKDRGVLQVDLRGMLYTKDALPTPSKSPCVSEND